MESRINELLDLISHEKEEKPLYSYYLELLALMNNQNKFNLVEKHSLDFLELVKNYKDKTYEIKCRNQLGYSYFNLNFFDKALIEYTKAVKLCYEENNKKDLAISLNGISGVYYKKKEYSKTIEYSEKCYELLKNTDQYDTLLNNRANLSLLYITIQDFAKAKKMLSEAKTLKEKYNLKGHEIAIYNNLAWLHYYDKKYDLAIDTLEKIIDKLSGRDYIAIKTTIALFIKDRDGNNQKAKKILLELLPVSKEIDEESTHFIYKNLYEMYEEEKNYKKSLDFHKKYFEIYEKMYNKESVRNIEEMKAKFDLLYNEKEKELYRLKNIDLKNSLEKNLQLSSELKKKAEENERLLRVLTHDLSNPLQAIVCSNELLKISTKEPNSFKHLDRIKEMTENMIKIISMIRQQLAIEAGKATLNLVKVDLKETLTKSYSVFLDKLADKDITIEIKYQNPEKDYFVLAEPVSLLNSVFNNILSNAVKFSLPKSKISIYVKEIEKQVAISFRDYGIGIKKENIKKIFDSTGTTSTSGTMGESGTGFGMPLAKKYTERYKGKINLESYHIEDYPKDHGTKVTLIFRKAS